MAEPKPRDVWVDEVWQSDLKPLERLVALVFAKHASQGVDAVWVTYPTLMEHTGLSRDSVARHIAGLRAAGWIEQTEPPRQHRAARYRLVSSPGTRPLDADTGSIRGTGAGRLDQVSSPGAGRLSESSSPAPESSSPAPRIQQSGSRTRTSTKPLPNHHGGVIHRYDPNARSGLTTIIATRRLPFTLDELLEAAYTLGDGDPWDGYLAINDATSTTFADARDPRAVIIHRLRERGLPDGVLAKRTAA